MVLTYSAILFQFSALCILSGTTPNGLNIFNLLPEGLICLINDIFIKILIIYYNLLIKIDDTEDYAIKKRRRARKPNMNNYSTESSDYAVSDANNGSISYVRI